MIRNGRLQFWYTSLKLSWFKHVKLRTCVFSSVLDSYHHMLEVTLASNQTAESMMASSSSLWEMTDLLSEAGEKLSRAQRRNQKSAALLQYLEVTRQITHFWRAAELSVRVIRTFSPPFIHPLPGTSLTAWKRKLCPLSCDWNDPRPAHKYIRCFSNDVGD